MKLLLLRHAETTWNKMGFLGHTNIELSKKGENYARMAYFGRVDKVYSSPSTRAVRTAELVFKKSVVIDNRLRELNFGSFENLTLEEAQSKFPVEFEKRRDDKWNVPAPFGETYREAAVRLSSFIDDVIGKNYESIAAVSHATLIKIALILYASKDLNDAERIYIQPCSAFEFVFDKGRVISWRRL